MDSFFILMIIALGSFIGMILTWAIWTAPWIRENGYRSSRWWSWIIFGTAIYNDIIIAVQIARKHRVWPKFLTLQLMFLGIIIGCIIKLIFWGP